MTGPRMTGARISGVATARSALAGWAPTLTCYTAALAGYLAVEDDRWWLRLVEGGPYLALSQTPGGLFAFRHHPRPPADLVGLRPRGADDWDTAWDGMRDELAAHGRVVVAADAWNVPWLTSHRRRHGPHWFGLARAGHRYVVDDPLDLVDECGRQQPVRVELAEADLRECCGALVAPAPQVVLREEAALGTAQTELGRRYRWLVRGEPTGPRPEPAAPLGMHGLADWFAGRAHDPAAYAQVDDIWQALRQRELAVRVLDVHGARFGLSGLPAPEPWRQVLGLWRRVPPLLMHARLLAQHGTRGHGGDGLVGTLHAIADAESRLTDQRFPEVVP